MTAISSTEPLLQLRLAGDHFKAAEERFCGQKSLDPNQWAIVRLDGHGFSRWVKRNFPTIKDNNWSWAFEYAMSTAAKEMAELYRPRLVYTFSDEVTLAFAPNQVQNLNGGRILKLCTLMASAMTARFAASANLALRKANHPMEDLATFDARAISVSSVDLVALNIGWRMCDARRNSVAHWARQHSSAKELHRLSSSQLIEHTEKISVVGKRAVTPWLSIELERRCGRLFQQVRTSKVLTEEQVQKLLAENPKFVVGSLVKSQNQQTGAPEYLVYRTGYEERKDVLESFCRENPKNFFLINPDAINQIKQMLVNTEQTQQP